MEKYIGTKKVTESNELDGKVQFTLEDGSSETVQKRQFDSIARDVVYDHGMVRVYRWLPAVDEILEILFKYDMKHSERQFVLSRVDESIINNYDKANAMLYGVDYEHNISLQDIYKVIRGERIAVDKEDPQTTTTIPVDAVNQA